MAKIDNDASVSDEAVFRQGVPYIKLIVNTWSKRLCALMGRSNVDLKS